MAEHRPDYNEFGRNQVGSNPPDELRIPGERGGRKGEQAEKIRAYMGRAEKWTNIGPITMNLDETKWDRIPPMSRTFLGRGGPGAVGGQIG